MRLLIYVQIFGVAQPCECGRTSYAACIEKHYPPTGDVPMRLSSKGRVRFCPVCGQISWLVPEDQAIHLGQLPLGTIFLTPSRLTAVAENREKAGGQKIESLGAEGREEVSAVPGAVRESECASNWTGTWCEQDG